MPHPLLAAASSALESHYKKGRHLALFCESNELLDEMKYYFIKQGLLNHESCTLTTRSNLKSVIKKLKNFGIDADLFAQEHLLHIEKISKLMKGEDRFRATKRVFHQLKGRYEPSNRWAGGYFTNLESRQLVDLNIAVEEWIHSNFTDFHGSILCPYLVKRVPLQDRASWMVRILKAHYIAIFVDSSGHVQVIEL